MRLARNILWNAVGIVLPLAVGVVVVPAIVKGLGTERFGFLSIVWMMIGYFSIFDFGLGRALTKLAADRLGERRESEVAALTATSLILVLGTSVVIGVGLALSAGWIAHRAMGAAPELIPEATTAIVWLAASLPFVLLATVLAGLLEAYQRFMTLSAVRLPMGILTLAAPLAILPWTHDLAVLTAVVGALRLANAVALGWLALRVVPALRHELLHFRRQWVRPLLTFGGWLTVSNLISPLMLYFDRFVIAAVMGSAAIAYYTVPYDVLNRLLYIPQAIQGVLFPNFAMLRVQNSPRVVAVFSRGSLATLLLMVPALFLVMLCAHPGLNLWMGATFAQHSTLVAKTLMVGVLVNAMARTPFVFVQAVGYARWTAVLHVLELPIYATALWLLLHGDLGIEGAALAWSGRMVVDTVALYVMTARLEPRLLPTLVRDLALVVAACSSAMVLSRNYS